MPLAAPTAVQASVKQPTAYHIPKLAARPASTQIPKEVKQFRDSGHTDDQIEHLGRKIAQKANRAKKREDVIEISDNEGEQTESTTSMDSKFVGSTTLLTDSTKSKTKTTPMSQRPGTSYSTSQVQSTAVTAKVPNICIDGIISFSKYKAEQ
uniref:Uncharacterized protein n=1 Tax=Romanomermis culicivorax TaxID=13658 RepID=A0A915IKB9_ROMCU